MTYSATTEIIEVAATQDLTVLATAKAELGIPDADTLQDDKITRWIHEISSQICSRVNRVIGREKVKETFELGWHGNLGPLCLSRYPVAIIDSVSEHGTELGSSSYRCDGIKGLLFRNYGRWHGEVIVQYQAGYQLLAELPYDIERAALLLIRYRQAAGQRDPLLRSETIPGVYEAAYWVGTVPGSDASMPSDVAELLRPYIDPAI